MIVLDGVYSARPELVDLVLRFLHFYPSHQKALAVGTASVEEVAAVLERLAITPLAEHRRAVEDDLAARAARPASRRLASAASGALRSSPPRGPTRPYRCTSGFWRRCAPFPACR